MDDEMDGFEVDDDDGYEWGCDVCPYETDDIGFLWRHWMNIETIMPPVQS